MHRLHLPQNIPRNTTDKEFRTKKAKKANSIIIKRKQNKARRKQPRCAAAPQPHFILVFEVKLILQFLVLINLYKYFRIRPRSPAATGSTHMTRGSATHAATHHPGHAADTTHEQNEQHETKKPRFATMPCETQQKRGPWS